MKARLIRVTVISEPPGMATRSRVPGRAKLWQTSACGLRRCNVVGDERSRLHEIVERLPEQELSLACQLLELLSHGSAALRTGRRTAFRPRTAPTTAK